MTVEEHAYELPEIWEAAWFSQEDRDRFREVAALVPSDAKTLVDVGCGNGLFVNGLRKSDAKRFDRLAGVDRSAAALAHVQVTRCRARVDALPFRNRSFDMASSMEVLEHLPVAVYPLALSELGRIARKYVLVSVPYRQDLAASMSTCPSCKTQFNADFHVRSFDEATLSGLFDGQGYHLVSSQLLGATKTYIDRSIRTRLWNWLRPATGMPAYAICPVCGFHDADGLRRELARRADAPPATAAPESPLRTWSSRFRPSVTTHRWICAVYAR